MATHIIYLKIKSFILKTYLHFTKRIYSGVPQCQVSYMKTENAYPHFRKQQIGGKYKKKLKK